MPSVRAQRVRELLKRTLGEIIRRQQAPDSSVLAVVNDLELAPDLKSATVFIGVVGQKDQQRKVIDQLNEDRISIQEQVARAVVLRYTPRLRFQLDTSVERGNRILSILDEIEREEPGSES